MNKEEMKAKVQSEIDKYQDEFWQAAEYIHANPELKFEEYKASKTLCDLLKSMVSMSSGATVSWRRRFGQLKKAALGDRLSAFYANTMHWLKSVMPAVTT